MSGRSGRPARAETFNFGGLTGVGGFWFWRDAREGGRLILAGPVRGTFDGLSYGTGFSFWLGPVAGWRLLILAGSREAGLVDFLNGEIFCNHV